MPGSVLCFILSFIPPVSCSPSCFPAWFSLHTCTASLSFAPSLFSVFFSSLSAPSLFLMFFFVCLFFKVQPFVQVIVESSCWVSLILQLQFLHSCCWVPPSLFSCFPDVSSRSPDHCVSMTKSKASLEETRAESVFIPCFKAWGCVERESIGTKDSLKNYTYIHIYIILQFDEDQQVYVKAKKKKPVDWVRKYAATPAVTVTAACHANLPRIQNFAKFMSKIFSTKQKKSLDLAIFYTCTSNTFFFQFWSFEV